MAAARFFAATPEKARDCGVVMKSEKRPVRIWRFITIKLVELSTLNLIKIFVNSKSKKYFHTRLKIDFKNCQSGLLPPIA